MTRNGEGHGLPRLQATLQEAKEIVALTDQGVMVTGFDASRATAMSDDLQHYQIVHFATHGLVSNEHPEMSGIVLSLVDKQGNEENGFLQLHDIYNLRLSAELVTLSACSTGLGKEVGGEGLVGLTHGFMYAGAKRMLTSLWKVDDRATAELMQRFYRELLVQRKSPAAALRSAKVALLQQKRWQPPFYWGAFVFQGDPTSVITLSSVPWYKSRGLYLLTILSLILPICVYAYRWMKKRSDRRRNGPGVLP
jgi:CHAT domain-containing protein